MKRVLLYTVILFAGFIASCKKEDSPVLEDPDTRLTAVLAEYQNILISAPNGWKASISPKGGKAYSFYVKFDDKARVKMLSDFDLTTALTPLESSYRLKALQRPTLIFDTYSYIHLLSDPNAGISGGATGSGLKSDFEFAFTKVTADTIKMQGTFNENELLLVRANESEAALYNSGALKTMMQTTSAFVTQNPYVYLQFQDGVKVQATVNSSTKVFSLAYVESNEVKTATTTFAFTTNGIRLEKPLTYKEHTFQELVWDEVAQTFYVTINGSRTNVRVSPTPIVPLHLLIGVDYNIINVPQAANAGWSADFTTKRSTVANAILVGPYKLSLRLMTFSFNTVTKTMNLTAEIYQGTRFTAVFPYTYTKTADGTFDFTAQSPTGNAALIVNEMKLITDHIKDDQFVLDYFSSPATGVLGQFRSVNNPGFYFAGTLSK